MPQKTDASLPIRNILFICLLLLLSGCLDLPNCMGGYEYTTYNLDLHVVESDESRSEFSIIRTMQFQAYDSRPDVIYDLMETGRFSSDGSALILGDYDARFLNFGPSDAPSDSIWDNNQAVIETLYSVDMARIDIYPPDAGAAYGKTIYDTLHNPFNNHSYGDKITEARLQLQSLPSGTQHTQILFETTFLDSSEYRTNQTLAPRYDKEGHILFMSSRVDFKIPDIADSNGDHTIKEQEHWLVRLMADGSRDSLFMMPEQFHTSYTQYGHNIKIYYGEGVIAVSNNSTLFVFNESGHQLLTIDEPGNVKMSPDGRAFSYKDGKKYYRLTDGRQIDLTDVVSKVVYQQPYKEELLVMSAEDKVYVVDADDGTITQTITIGGDLPILAHKKGKESTKWIFYPVFTPDDKIRLLYADSYYFNDPDNPCD